MKHTILCTLTIIALFACPLYAERTEKLDEATLLRQKIQEQELALQALKEKLATLEATQGKIFQVLVTSEGLQAFDKPITHDELEKELKELPEDAKILIQAAASVSHQELVSVMELCAKTGLQNVALSTIKNR